MPTDQNEGRISHEEWQRISTAEQVKRLSAERAARRKVRKEKATGGRPTDKHGRVLVGEFMGLKYWDSRPSELGRYRFFSRNNCPRVPRKYLWARWPSELISNSPQLWRESGTDTRIIILIAAYFAAIYLGPPVLDIALMVLGFVWKVVWMTVAAIIGFFIIFLWLVAGMFK